MKLAFLGDTHFGARNDSIVFAEYFKKFYEEEFFPYLVKNKIKTVIQFGDLMDRRKFVNFHTLNLMKEYFLSRFKELDIQLIVLLGNHDIYYKNTNRINSLNELFQGYPNVTIVQDPTTFEFGKAKLDIIPWISPENEESILDFIKQSESGFLCGHLELRGFEMNKGHTSEHGYEESVFKKYQQVYSGHYHTKSSNGHINYLGTPYEITWHDCNDEKGFYVFDTNKGTTQFIKNPLKMYHKIFYDDSQYDYSPNEFDFSYYKDSYVRVIITNRDDIAAFDDFVEALYKNAKPHDISITDSSVSYRDVDLEEIETQDPLTVLLNQVDIDTVSNIDRDDVKRIVREVYHEALALGQEK